MAQRGKEPGKHMDKGAAGDTLSMSSSSSTDDQEAADKKKKDLLPTTPVIPIPDYTEEELNKLIMYVQRMTMLFALDHRDWCGETLTTIRRWFMEVNYPLMTIFYDRNILSACLGFPLAPVADICYFVRKQNQIFSVEGFHDEIYFGTIQEDVDGCLLKIMQYVYQPIFRNYKDWNDNIKSRFCRAMDKFLCYLTSLHYKMSGLTVLYVPYVVKQISRADVQHDREFVKNLEAIVVYWTTQIRTLINDKTLIAQHDFVVPTEEYEFWLYRFEVLQGLDTQLQHEDVQQIIHVLRNSHSVYIKQVDELIEECHNEMEEAKSNIKYLFLLNEPCSHIDQAESPAAVPALIPRIVNIIRYIWLNSEFYQRRDLITGLFRNLSNQIIKFSLDQVNVDKVLQGNPRFGIRMANMAIDCCLSYRAIYDLMSKEHATRKPDIGWDLENAMIFNHVDAFIERLNDLIDICESMIVFGRLDETEAIPKPTFGGTNGEEFERTAEGVEKQFMVLLDALEHDSKELILNVNKNEWYEEVLKYRRTVQSFEETIQRLMSNVFQRICNIEEGLEVLNVTLFYSYRASIRKTFLRQVSDVWIMFDKEMSDTTKMLMERVKLHESWLPYYVSRAIGYRINLERLQWLRDRLNTSEWMPVVPEAKIVLDKFENLKKDYTKEIKKAFDDWVNNCSSPTLESRLERTLLIRSKVKRGLIECNMDRSILSICEQARHFDNLGFQIPPLIRKVYDRYSTLQFVYNSVLTVCLDYNRILAALSEQERTLFRALIHACDRKIAPGLFKLTWSGELSDAYIADCAKHTKKLQDSLDIYKRANRQIAKTCEKICDTALIKIALSGAVELPVFELSLAASTRKATNIIIGHYETIVDLLFAVFQEFQPVLDEMESEWYEYIIQFDAMLNAALMTCARNSLLNVYNLVRSEGDILPSPILILEADIVDGKIQLNPNMKDIMQLFSGIFERVSTSLAIFPRLTAKLKLPKEYQQPIFSVTFANDLEAKEIQSSLEYEVKYNEEEIETFLMGWRYYRDIWEKTELEFTKNILSTDQKSYVFEQSIEYYSSLADEIGMKDSIVNVYFILVNQNFLKNTLMDYIEKWQMLNIKLLLRRATTKINGVYRYMRKNGDRIQIIPRNLKEAREATELYEFLFSDAPRKQAEFPAMLSLFKLLDYYLVEIPEGTRKLVNNLETEWDAYLKILLHSSDMLEMTREEFKKTLLRQAEKFKTVMKEFLGDFLLKLPTSAHT